MSTMRVLLVEDHPSWQMILQEKTHQALQEMGCEAGSTIRVVGDFARAWEALRKEGPWHLLVTDIGLGSKYEAMLGKLLVEEASKLQVPTIAVSGTMVITRQEVGELITEDKACAFFEKGQFDGRRFIAKIQEFCEVSWAEPSTNPDLRSQ